MTARSKSTKRNPRLAPGVSHAVPCQASPGHARPRPASPSLAVVGYARCSTTSQDLTPQIEQLKAAGCTRIYAEKISGARNDRPQWLKLMASLKAGDAVLVCKIDRAGRSTRELLNAIHEIGQIGATFRSLGDPLFDTAGPQGKLLLAIMAAVAEFERSLIVTRTSEGRARAKAAGVKFGRPPVLTAFQKAEAYKRRKAGEPLSLLAQAYCVSVSTIARLSP
jgi:DNA invertase Pin-like site-specific DNA recombinase